MMIDDGSSSQNDGTESAKILIFGCGFKCAVSKKEDSKENGFDFATFEGQGRDSSPIAQ